MKFREPERGTIKEIRLTNNLKNKEMLKKINLMKMLKF